MTDEHRETGIGWPDEQHTAAAEERAAGEAEARGADELDADSAAREAAAREAAAREAAGRDSAGRAGPTAGEAVDTRPEEPSGTPTAARPADQARKRRLSAAGAVIGVLLALLGFTLVVQVKSNTTDPTLASARQEDLVRILSDLESRDQRLREDISRLEESKRQLDSGAQGREAALEAARQRADQLGILAGTLPAFGPGLLIDIRPATKPVGATALIDAVQELRGAGAEAMQVAGGEAAPVRIIASTSFVDADGGVLVDGQRLTSPFTIIAIGPSKTMETALEIPGGFAETVRGDGGTVTLQQRDAVTVDARSQPKTLEYAQPVA